MATYEYVINGEYAMINVHLPFKFTDNKTRRKIMDQVNKTILFCNSKNSQISDKEKLARLENEDPQYECDYCKKKIKKLNGLTTHLKTCKLKPKIEEEKLNIETVE